MIKKGILIGIVMVFLVGSFASGVKIEYVTQQSSRGNILYVGGSEPGNYSKIQDAIDNASDGDTVFVYDDSSPYFEKVIVDKSINLLGENRNTTVINGSYKTVVHVTADWVNISGFTMESGGGGTPGILLVSNNNNISENIILNNYYGIWLEEFSNINFIVCNIISNNEYGIWVGEFNSNNIIAGNTISLNHDVGIRFIDSSNNAIIGNNISLNRISGISFTWSSNNIISGNTIANNGDGIRFYSSSNNIITGNNISNNNCGIYLWDFSNNNIVYHNNLINNTQSAYDECTNFWDNGYPNGGNYWDDYPYDDYYHGPNQDKPGHDRIGDIPYDLPCEHATDYYPVMKPYGWLNEAPENITIDGPTSGKAGQLYTYTTSADDPEIDPIYYKFDWGDNTTSDWLGPYISGTEASDSHSWSVGTFDIKVKAKDTRGLESPWSDPLIITMPRDKSINNLFFRLFENYPFLYQLFQLLLQRLGLQ